MSDAALSPSEQTEETEQRLAEFLEAAERAQHQQEQRDADRAFRDRYSEFLPPSEKILRSRQRRKYRMAMEVSGEFFLDSFKKCFDESLEAQAREFLYDLWCWCVPTEIARQQSGGVRGELYRALAFNRNVDQAKALDGLRGVLTDGSGLGDQMRAYLVNEHPFNPDESEDARVTHSNDRVAFIEDYMWALLPKREIALGHPEIERDEDPLHQTMDGVVGMLRGCAPNGSRLYSEGHRTYMRLVDIAFEAIEKAVLLRLELVDAVSDVYRGIVGASDEGERWTEVRGDWSVHARAVAPTQAELDEIGRDEHRQAFESTVAYIQPCGKEYLCAIVAQCFSSLMAVRMDAALARCLRGIIGSMPLYYKTVFVGKICQINGTMTLSSARDAERTHAHAHHRAHPSHLQHYNLMRETLKTAVDPDLNVVRYDLLNGEEVPLIEYGRAHCARQFERDFSHLPAAPAPAAFSDINTKLGTQQRYDNIRLDTRQRGVVGDSMLRVLQPVLDDMHTALTTVLPDNESDGVHGAKRPRQMFDQLVRELLAHALALYERERDFQTFGDNRHITGGPLAYAFEKVYIVVRNNPKVADRLLADVSARFKPQEWLAVLVRAMLLLPDVRAK